jgi:hypothetical protein
VWGLKLSDESPEMYIAERIRMDVADDMIRLLVEDRT